MRILFFVFALLISACQADTSKTEESASNKADSTASAEVNSPSPIDTIVKPVIDYDSSIWTDVFIMNPDIHQDIRYATIYNFVEEKMYDCGRCFLRKEVAQAVARIQEELNKEQLGLKMFDCYRPRPIQWKLWEKVPDPRYVADPRKGSMHNRGSAIDLTLVDSEGNELDMGTEFDFFGPEAYHSYTQHHPTILENRKKLKNIMEANGFRSTRTEWWHYSYRLKSYELSDWLWNCNK